MSPVFDQRTREHIRAQCRRRREQHRSGFDRCNRANDSLYHRGVDGLRWAFALMERGPVFTCATRGTAHSFAVEVYCNGPRKWVVRNVSQYSRNVVVQNARAQVLSADRVHASFIAAKRHVEAALVWLQTTALLGGFDDPVA